MYSTRKSSNLSLHFLSPQVPKLEMFGFFIQFFCFQVVQIEKFWDDNDTSNCTQEKSGRRSPVIVKYALDEDGSLVKAAETAHDSEDQEYVDMYQCVPCGVQFPRREQFDGHACEPEIGNFKQVVYGIEYILFP